MQVVALVGCGGSNYGCNTEWYEQLPTKQYKKSDYGESSWW